MWTKYYTIIGIGIVAVIGGIIAYAQIDFPLGGTTIEATNMEQAFMVSDIAGDYTLEGTTFTKPAVDENSVKVKIGNNTDEFTPDFYISRWEDEVYFKMTPRDLDKVAKADKELIFENKKIKFETPDVDYNMYELENAFEYEVILKTKPVSNVITFDIETVGLDFFYQPELTQEEIDNGFFRPENIVGSYAVYHSTKKNHIMGQKNYMAGKAFHIFRPQMEDANGWKVWGELNVTGSILSVTIPADFIDNAKYPIRHATGLTIGYTTQAQSTSDLNADQAVGSQINPTASADGDVDSVHFYGVAGGSGRNFKGFVTASDNTILTNGVSDATAFTEVTGWQIASYSTKPSLVDTNDYYPFIVFSGSGTYYYDSGSAGDGWYDGSNSYASPTDPTDANSSTLKQGVYATYSIPAVGGGYEPVPPALPPLWIY